MHPPLVSSKDAMAAVLLLVHRPKGAGVGQPQDVEPDLVQPGPPVRQARAYRHLKVPSLWWETRRAGPLGNGTF